MNARDYRYKYMCKDITQVENYDVAKKVEFKGWVLHHRKESHNDDGTLREEFISKQWLIDNKLYWNQSPEELIFMTTSDHRLLHSKDEIMRKKHSEGMKGHFVSDETRKKLSERRRVLLESGWTQPEDARRRISEKNSGRKAWNSGKRGIYTAETLKKIGDNTRGRKWFTNGEDNVMAYSCPEGYHAGMTRKAKEA